MGGGAAGVRGAGLSDGGHGDRAEDETVRNLCGGLCRRDRGRDDAGLRHGGAGHAGFAGGLAFDCADDRCSMVGCGGELARLCGENIKSVGVYWIALGK